MPLPRLRFSVRRMMVVIAFLALVIGPGAETARLVQIAYRYQESAKGCRKMAEASLRTADSLGLSSNDPEIIDEKVRRGLRAAQQRWIQYADYHSSFALKCDKAVRRPWVPVEDFAPPDFPFPDDWYLGPR
jgi:hypothetical protein